MTSRSNVLLWTLSVLVLAFLWSPLLVILVVSFDTSNYLAFPPQGFTLDNYAAVLANRDFVSGFAISLVTGLIVSLVATTLGVLAALGIRRARGRAAGALSTFILSPLLMPSVVLGLALMLVFARLQLVDTRLGLVLAHTVITLPYAFRTVLASLETYNASSEDAARVLGARPFTVFRRVTLPLIRPGVASALVLGFLVSFDESVISLFVTGRQTRTLPVVLLNYIEVQADPVVAALSVVLVAISVVVMLIVNRIVGLRAAVRA